MAGEVGRRSRDAGCWWQYATKTRHGIGTWGWDMGEGGTVLGEITRYYQITFLSTENHGSVGGGKGERSGTNWQS